MRKESGFAQILVVVLFLIGVASLGLYYIGSRQNAPILSLPSQSPTASSLPTSDPTANWKTFANPNVNFTLRYPLDFKITYEPENKNVDFPNTLLTLETNKSFNNSHLTTWGIFLVQFIPNLKTSQACYILSDNSTPLTKSKTINGNTFYYADKPGKVGLGTIYVDRELKLFQDVGDKCYEMDLKYSKNSDWNNPNDIELANKDQEETFNTFDQILSTFKFTNQ